MLSSVLESKRKTDESAEGVHMLSAFYIQARTKKELIRKENV